MDYKKIFEKFEGNSGFIKTTVPAAIDSTQKAALNRRGNVLFNSGDIEGARRIFQATRYSDGLSRVGDYYKSQNRLIDALQMYWIAPDRTKSEPVIMQLAELMQQLIHGQEGQEGSEDE
ncbi:MAG: hypothetical protein LBQ69_05980 [Treponema sp.]|jgi:hypothetical protein|nr:hypothetical protein [Treponema sp.]